MSVYKAVVDAVTADLQANVGGLATTAVTLHKLTPWKVDRLFPDGGKHLAMWPLGEGRTAERKDPMNPTGSHNWGQAYDVWYWEPALDQERAYPDETAAETLLQLLDATMARFYVTANQQLGGSWRLWAQEVEILAAPGVRGFRIGLTAQWWRAFA